MYYKYKTKLFYKFLFSQIGEKSRIFKPLKITNPKYMTLKSRVVINKYSWLLTIQINEKKPELIFDDDVIIGHFNHITCVNRVYIGKNVLTADRVYITDNYHGYEDINMPISKQPVKSKGEVIIGDETWIGDNVSIISCKIGKHCIIGANSVVNRDIPDYCIAAGAPAKIVKRYNFQSKKWEKTNEKGEFINE